MALKAIHSIQCPRPSVILLGLFLVASFGTSYLAQGSPIPAGDTRGSIEAQFNEGVKAADDFIQRAKNTFSGRADSDNGVPGLTPWEIAGVVAAAVVLGFIAFCCIGYCLCECVKELVCCICCCKCCRD